MCKGGCRRAPYAFNNIYHWLLATCLERCVYIFDCHCWHRSLCWAALEDIGQILERKFREWSSYHPSTKLLFTIAYHIERKTHVGSPLQHTSTESEAQPLIHVPNATLAVCPIRNSGSFDIRLSYLMKKLKPQQFLSFLPTNHRMNTHTHTSTRLTKIVIWTSKRKRQNKNLTNFSLISSLIFCILFLFPHNYTYYTIHILIYFSTKKKDRQSNFNWWILD